MNSLLVYIISDIVKVEYGSTSTQPQVSLGVSGKKTNNSNKGVKTTTNIINNSTLTVSTDIWALGP